MTQKNIYKRKDGRYEGRYIKDLDFYGRAIYGYIYSKRYMEVKDKLEKLNSSNGGIKINSNMKLSEWLRIWLDMQCGLKPTTLRVYKSYINNNINPRIGDFTLKSINSDLIQSFVNKLTLCPSTVKSIYTILKSSLNAADDRGLLICPRSKIKLPKRELSETKVLTKKEQQCLENSLTDNSDIGILISLYTGLRIGEICALRWSDISFDRGMLYVNGTQTRTSDGVFITSPKSKTSKRIIPIPPFLLSKLKQLPKKNEFVISHNNKHYDVRTYRRHFKTVLKKSNLPDMKFHSLRHTFATRALEIGMDYKTLSEILGHSSVAITLDLYAHSLNEHKKKEMYKMEEVFKS